MPYAQVEVSAPRHRKLSNLSDVAFRLWVTALCYCQEHLTDGLIHAEALGTLTPHRIARAKVVDELVGHGLWVPTTNGGYHVHDYLTWNESRAQVEARKAKIRERQERWRAAKGNASHNALQDALVAPLVTRPRVRAPALRSVSLSDEKGESEREEPPNPPPAADLDAYWQAWRAAASQHGTDIRLGASATEREHLRELASAYTVEDVATAAQVFWASPHVPGRALGLFRSMVADLLAFAASGKRGAFRAQAGAAPARHTEPSHTGWACPHEPRCARQWDCHRKSEIAAMTEAS